MRVSDGVEWLNGTYRCTDDLCSKNKLKALWIPHSKAEKSKVEGLDARKLGLLVVLHLPTWLLYAGSCFPHSKKIFKNYMKLRALFSNLKIYLEALKSM